MNVAQQDGISKAPRSSGMNARFRLWGLFPLTFFVSHFYYNWGQGNPGNVLWMCHVSNALMAAGFLLDRPPLIRLATIWLIPGIPLWIMDMVQFGMTTPITYLTHLGSLAVGLVGLRRVGAGPHTWFYAFLLFLVVRQLSRTFTPPELNVNVAHTMYPGWERVFGAYWQYWLFTTASAALALYVLGRILLLVAPPRLPADTYNTHADASR